MNEKETQKKRNTEKKQIVFAIDKQIAKALSLVKSKESSRYAIESIYVNKETKEIVATDGRHLLIVTMKSEGFFNDILETGLYDIIGANLLEKNINNADIHFPIYQDAVPKTKEVYKGSALRGIINCIIGKQVYIDIWRFESVLKILDKISSEWIFTNEAPNRPVLMEAETISYKIKYIMMCYTP